ncbi:hypothetical protein PJI16_09050 [Nitrospira sp. MA-1]|nr:hypothetical protein [Nitrospira sp. MA-1]
MSIEKPETSPQGLDQRHSSLKIAREMAESQQLARQLATQMLFAARHTIWQLSRNENIPGLRWRDLSKGMNWSG